MTSPAAALYVMAGGFLGAGKTTALLRLADWLTARGLRVGLITNDQSTGLVDTALASARGVPVEEIAGGCFCCRFTSLVDAAERLSAAAAPDVFLAEPVGSCTDLTATVSYPLRQMYGEAYAIAPYSVLLDPVRALRVLGLEPGRSFSKKVLYVYEKQIEEAELVVINKIDAVDSAQVAALQDALAARFPNAERLLVSARTGAGLEPWFGRLLDSRMQQRPTIDVDYDEYAEGEARLGWLNCTARVTGDALDGNAFVQDIAADVRARLLDADVEVAHLKMTLSADVAGIAVLNLVRTDAAPEFSHVLAGDIDTGELILNLRAEAPPELLRDVALAAVRRRAEAARADVRFEHAEHFRPGRPMPVHRMTVAGRA